MKLNNIDKGTVLNTEEPGRLSEIGRNDGYSTAEVGSTLIIELSLEPPKMTIISENINDKSQVTNWNVASNIMLYRGDHEHGSWWTYAFQSNDLRKSRNRRVQSMRSWALTYRLLSIDRPS